MRKVPTIARWLVARIAAADDRAYVLADLDEGYRSRSARDGRFAAWRWYWWQALRAVPAAWSGRRVTAESWTESHRGRASTVRHAVRVLVRRPLYSGGVIATLGLGLAAAGAVFAVAWGVWLRPLPIQDSQQLVRVYEVNLRAEANAEDVAARTSDVPQSRWTAMSPPFLTDLQDAGLRSLPSVGTVLSATFDWQRESRVARISAQVVSPETFQILAIRPIIGRLPLNDPAAKEVVLTAAFWRTAFGEDASVTDRRMRLDGVSYAIVGVISSPGGYPSMADVWVPLHFEEGALQEGMRGARYLDVIGRVRAGSSIAEVSAEIDAYMRSLGEAHPNHRGWGAAAVPLKDDLVRPFRAVLLVLIAAGAVFLLLATVNVAGLVAARRAETRRARSIRIALGASHGQILREGIVESTLLGAAASLVAIAGVYWLLTPIRRLVPPDVPRLEGIAASPAVLLGIAIAGLCAGLLVGLLGHLMSGARPILIAGNRDAGKPGVRGRRVLLTTQIALTTWLLLGGIALVRHMLTLRSVDYGFSPAAVTTSFLSLSPQRQGANGELSWLFWQDLLRQLESRGVTAAVGTNAPVSGSSMRFGYGIEGDDSQYWGQYHAVTDAYFDVLDIDMTAGRAFTERDRAGSAPVVIINEELARRHFAGTDPVGQSIRVVADSRTIVGVARSTRHFGPDQEPPPELYVPLAQDPSPFANVLVQSAAETSRSGDAATFNEVVTSIDPDLHTPPLQPFSIFIREWFAPLRLQLLVVTVFGGAGALLAALGVYALVAYIVSNGRRDIGIRLALGEQSRAVFRRVLGQGLVLAVIGIAFGTLAAAFSRAALLRLADIDALDPELVAIVGLIVTLVAMLASVLPAHRAVTVDPIVTLRAE